MMAVTDVARPRSPGCQMTTNESSNVTPMTQEVRLATTMTGGVSLAIWMAGVAREINLLAQASQWRRMRGDGRLCLVGCRSGSRSGNCMAKLLSASVQR